MEKQPGVLGKRGNLWFGLSVSLLVLLYTWVLIAVPDRFFADDSYFYFQVAWNFARGMGSTFNNLMPTNGYHPLWMLVCAAVFKVVPSRPQAIHAIGAVIALLNVLMLWTVRRVLARVAEDLWPVAFVLILPFCFVSQLGTEGALSGFFLAQLMLLAYLMSESPSTKGAVLFSLMGTLAVLSRLDNIFIVSFVWVGVWIALGETGKRRFRRLLLATLPIYGVMWGAYIGSNWIYFHTIEPISGLLKSNSLKDHGLGGNLPHTALLSLAIIAICLAIIAARKRDLFFRTVEVPFALGVLCHATYIVLRMSNETRWSWYYTSWILLAGVLMARTAASLLEERRRLAMPLAVVCLLVLAGAWLKVSYLKFYRGPSTIPPASFNDTVYGKEGIRNAFAYDQPGALAYYSDVHIVPLDGLMGDMAFQHDLATKGIAAVAAEMHINGFIGPPVGFGKGVKGDMCDQIYLSTEQFGCAGDENDGWNAMSVNVYARVPHVLAGTLPLNPNQIVWNKKNYIVVWRLTPADITAKKE